MPWSGRWTALAVWTQPAVTCLRKTISYCKMCLNLSGPSEQTPGSPLQPLWVFFLTRISPADQILKITALICKTAPISRERRRSRPQCGLEASVGGCQDCVSFPFRRGPSWDPGSSHNSSPAVGIILGTSPYDLVASSFPIPEQRSLNTTWQGWWERFGEITGEGFEKWEALR